MTKTQAVLLALVSAVIGALIAFAVLRGHGKEAKEGG
jgi:hypothetical protein